MMNPTVEYITDFIQGLINDREFKSRTYLGSGSSREVYKLTDELVIKLPCYFHYEKEKRPISFWHGLCQSNVEIEVWKSASEVVRKVLNPIVIHGVYEDLLWEVQPIVQVCEDMSQAYSVLDFAEEQEINFMSDEEYTNIIDELGREFGLQDGDLFDNCGNFGLNSNRKIVVIDYGFIGWRGIEDYIHEHYREEMKSSSRCYNSNSCSYSW